jgi:hypothetical protein
MKTIVSASGTSFRVHCVCSEREDVDADPGVEQLTPEDREQLEQSAKDLQERSIPKTRATSKASRWGFQHQMA